MSSALGWLWRSLAGLVVEDAHLAAGIVVALALVVVASPVGAVHPFLGWILLALLLVLLLVNLALTARGAARHRA